MKSTCLIQKELDFTVNCDIQDEAVSGTPIIAMTANAFEEDRQNAIVAGMNGHLAKPIDMGSLVEALGGIFQENKNGK